MCRAAWPAGRRCARGLWTCVKYGCLLHCVSEHVCDVVVCMGPSMEPTILSHDVVLTDRRRRVTRHYLRAGDVVVARSVQQPRQIVCKRVAAVAGEWTPGGGATGGAALVPRGHVWLLGDNAANSTDSRSYGPVPAALVLGRVVCKLWPPLQGGWLSTNKVAASSTDCH